MKKIKVSLFSLLALFTATNSFADLSAIVYARPTTAKINQNVAITVAVRNTGAAVTITNLQITANYNGVPGGRISMANSYYVPSSASVAVGTTLAPVTSQTPAMNVVFFAPSTGITGAGTGKYYVSAILTLSDGTMTGAATAARVTVNPILPPSYTQ